MAIKKPLSEKSKFYVLIIDEDRSKILKATYNTLLLNQFTHAMFSQCLNDGKLLEAFHSFSEEVAKKEHISGMCVDPTCKNKFHENI